MTERRGLAAEARRHIIERILDGRLGSGAVLSEARLGDELGMSRTPVREAIKRIESEGLAVKSGRFIRVRQPSAAEVEEIFFLRLQLEPQAARAAVHLPDARLAEMAARVQDLIDDTSAEDLWTVDDAFHAMMMDGLGNRVMAGVVEGLRGRTTMFDSSQVPERYLRGCQEHMAILEALQAGDGETAETLMAAHLANARDAILRRMDTLGLGGTP